MVTSLVLQHLANINSNVNECVHSLLVEFLKIQRWNIIPCGIKVLSLFKYFYNQYNNVTVLNFFKSYEVLKYNRDRNENHTNSHPLQSDVKVCL